MDKTLLVYYTYTGHTKFIADKIKNKIKCDVLELLPSIPYSSDYQEVVDKYQNNETAKSVTRLKKYSVDLEKYDTIIIGSPVWWYSITPVIRTFLKENNLANKTIIPYITNAGWAGISFKEIKELCPDSNIKNQINLVFSSEKLVVKNGNELDNWLDYLKKLS